MKKLYALMVLLLLAAVLTSGCCCFNYLHLPFSIPGIYEPIIGKWKASTSSSSYTVDVYMNVNFDKSFTMDASYAGVSINVKGTWESLGNNEYKFKPDTGSRGGMYSSDTIFVYDSGSDTIYQKGSSSTRFHRA